MVKQILVTNDDGFWAAGIVALAAALQDLGEVYVIAPDRERSACSHSVTVHEPLRVREVRLPDLPRPVLAVNGTPADCVKLAIDAIIPGGPELVVSGINLGANLGTDIFYSGTVAASLEGAFAGIPSVAISVTSEEVHDLSYAAFCARKLAGLVAVRGLPPGIALNVNVPNVPPEEVKGIEVTNLSWRRYIDAVHQRSDPRNRVYYWLAGKVTEVEPRPGSDLAAVLDGKISVTPLQLDLTATSFLPELKSWGLREELADPRQLSQIAASDGTGNQKG